MTLLMFPAQKGQSLLGKTFLVALILMRLQEKIILCPDKPRCFLALQIQSRLSVLPGCRAAVHVSI